MYYALRKDCYFRQYGEIGHIIIFGKDRQINIDYVEECLCYEKI